MIYILFWKKYCSNNKALLLYTRGLPPGTNNSRALVGYFNIKRHSIAKKNLVNEIEGLLQRERIGGYFWIFCNIQYLSIKYI